MREPQVLVVMGVSGVGKTTVATGLARRLGWGFLEGDELHPAENIAKMSAGVPLNDDDRLPWLRAIAAELSARAARGENTVVTCSALKRRYRDVLRTADARVRVVHLEAGADLIAQRLSHRTGHFMPPTLLPSQLADLEPLAPDEDGVLVNVAGTPTESVELALAALDL